MVYLSAAVIFVAALGFFNLVLIFAVIRRLRHQAGDRVDSPAMTVPPMLPAGSDAPDFTAASLSGGTCSLSGLVGQRSVIGFFSTSCKSCRAHLPAFVELARSVPGGPQQVIAVIEGTAAASAEILEGLAGSATVIFEASDGPVAKAFRVWGYPTFYALDERGKILAGAPTVQRLTNSVLV